jgi:hypothetical protein
MLSAHLPKSPDIFKSCSLCGVRMLLIDTTTLAPGKVDVGAVLADPRIETTALAFSVAPARLVPAGDKSVCVLQYEAATVLWNAKAYVGSQDATTCVIAVFVCKRGCTVLHFDENTVHNEEYLRHALRLAKGGAKLYLVGGYADEQGISFCIVESLLSWLHTQQSCFTICLAFVLGHNTRMKNVGGNLLVPVPVVAGVCVTPESDVVPALFEDRGPMLTQRMCRFITGCGTTTDLVFTATGEFTVEPWNFSVCEDERREFVSMSSLPDEEILALTSTSPDAEGPGFPGDIRRALRLVCQNPRAELMFPSAADGKALRFTWQIGEGWTRVGCPDAGVINRITDEVMAGLAKADIHRR